MNYFCYFSLAFICLLAKGQATFDLDELFADNVSFIYYSRHYLNGFFLNPNSSDILRVFDPRLPTVVLVHGWQSDYGADSISLIRNAILAKLDANIIKVDWSPLAKICYFFSRSAVPTVGKEAAQLLADISEKFDYSLSRVTLVGFSLGAHVCGNIGKNLTGEIGVLVALDPAGPFISPTDSDYRVHKTDAQYVQAIHTNGGNLGMLEPVGHSDFYPNGGSNQPGCVDDILGKCAHRRAWKYFAESINDSDAFVGTRCDSWEDYLEGNCHYGETSLMGGLENINVAARGTFYLTTRSSPPYGQH